MDAHLIEKSNQNELIFCIYVPFTKFWQSLENLTNESCQKYDAFTFILKIVSKYIECYW